jgi:hypothetical protein
MVAVTQVIPDLLGGISQQPDNQKDTGDLSDSINAYPDVTLGLVKRPGLQYVYETTTGLTDLDGGKWFFINRDGNEKYLACLQPGTTSSNGSFRIFNAATGVESTITYPDGKSYLEGVKGNFKILTVQDTTFIVNKTITVQAQATPSYTANLYADIVIESLAYDTEYTVVITSGGTTYTCTHTTLANKAAYGGVGINLSDVKNGVKAAINAQNIPGLVVDGISNGPVIQLSSSTPLSKLSATSDPGQDRIRIFGETVANISELPSYGQNNRKVKVINSEVKEDDYWVEFFTHNSPDEGKGYWQECKSPAVSAGLDDTTMPHQLINTAPDTFVFQEINYINRRVGDDLTNPHPSFKGNKIRNVFGYGNRIGFISADNVILSAASDFFSFYFRSARLIIDSDPIDLKAQSERPVTLLSTLGTPQGLLLFSTDQQFLLRAADNVISPSTCSIRKISNYDISADVEPLLLGTTAVFLTKSNQFRRMFAMDLNGPEEPPTVTELTKKVSALIPNGVDNFIENEQNQFVVASHAQQKTAFFYNYYVSGDEVLVKSWNKWQLPGNVLFIASDQEELLFVTSKSGHSITISKADITQSPSNAIIVNSDGFRVNPSMDYFTSPSSIVYDSTTNSTKCYLPYTNKSNLTPVVVINGDTSTGNYTDSGYNITPQRGTDGTGDFFIIPNKNMGADTSANRNKITVGYRFAYEVKLPTIYFRLDNDQADFTAGLIISRIKISCGLSGAVGYKLKGKGSTEWVDVSPVPTAGFYLADDIPLNSQREVTIPVHQQNTNFVLKLYDTTPFPISVGSIMWEGKYSPRFYRRQ